MCVVGLETMWWRESTSCAPQGRMIGSWNCQMFMNHLVQESKVMYITSPLKIIRFKMPEHITHTIWGTSVIRIVYHKLCCSSMYTLNLRWGLHMELQYSNLGLTSVCYAAVFTSEGVWLRLWHNRPRILFAFAVMMFTCWFHLRFFVIVTTR